MEIVAKVHTLVRQRKKSMIFQNFASGSLSAVIYGRG